MAEHSLYILDVLAALPCQGPVKANTLVGNRRSVCWPCAMPRPRKPANPFHQFNSSPEIIRLREMLYASSLPVVVAKPRESPVRAGDRHLSRDVAAVVKPLRINICSPHQSPAAEPHAWLPTLAVASRRNVREADWRDGLPLACSGPGGEVPESYVTRTREKAAALTFMRKALKRQGSQSGSPPTVCAPTAPTQ